MHKMFHYLFVKLTKILMLFWGNEHQQKQEKKNVI